MRNANIVRVNKRRHSQERNPCQILRQCRSDASKPEAVLEEGKADISKTREDEGARQPDLKRVQVVVVHAQCQAKDEVVDDREDVGAGDTIVGEHVCVYPSVIDL